MEVVKHKHHIVPKHAGGSDDPINLQELTISEHADAHKKLYEKYGRWQDKVAWLSLSGMIGKDEVLKEVYKNIDRSYTKTEQFKNTMSKATASAWAEGKKSGHTNGGSKNFIVTEDHKNKLRSYRKKLIQNDWHNKGPGK